MRQPWPSSHEAELREQPRPRLTQTLHNRTRSKSNDETLKRTSYPLKCYLSTIRIKENFISREISFIFDDEQMSFLSRFH